MCGLVGILSSLTAVQSIEQAAQYIQARGPEDLQYLHLPQLHLAHSRLILSGNRHHGRQPIQQGEWVMLYNGEIYNIAQLVERHLGKDIKHSPYSDTEWLMALIAAKGCDILEQLDGQFAIALYHSKQSKLYLVRDRFGICPLYYWYQNGLLAFASTLQALLPYSDKKVHTAAVYSHAILMYNGLDESIIKDIYKVPPGHCLQYDFQTGKRFLQAMKALPQDRSLTTQSVEAHIQSTFSFKGPCALAFSGGVDSSIIWGVWQKQTTSQPLHCYFVKDVFYKMDAIVPNADERIVNQINPSTTIVNTPTHIEAIWDEVIALLQEPQADPAIFQYYVLCQTCAKEGQKVLFAGAGADEYFLGYRRHQLLSWLDMLPAFSKHLIGRLAKSIVGKSVFTNKQVQKLQQIASHKDTLFQTYSWVPAEHLQICDNKDALQDYLQQWQQQFKQGSFLSNAWVFDKHVYLPNHNLQYLDSIAGAWGIEARPSFLGMYLLKNTLPYKRVLFETKPLLKRLAEQLLKQFPSKRSKVGFGSPLEQWILDPSFQSFLKSKTLNTIANKQFQLFDESYLEKVWQSDAKTLQETAYLLLSIGISLSWLERHIISSSKLKS